MLSNLGACFPPEGIGAQGPYRAFKNVTFFYNVLKIPAGIAIAIRYEVELFLFEDRIVFLCSGRFTVQKNKSL